MTEAQRDYLADLAADRGVRLKDTDNWSVAEASRKIEELKSIPPKVFLEISANEMNKIDKGINDIRDNLKLWGWE